MADNDEASGAPDHDATPTAGTGPVLPPEPESVPAAPTAASAPVMKPRWRDRVWTFRAMLAVALATLLLGGVVGGTIVAVADGHDDHPRFGMGPGGRFQRMPPGWRGPRQFHDGGPRWRWDDGPPPPDTNTTPYGTPAPQPAPPTPSQ